MSLYIRNSGTVSTSFRTYYITDPWGNTWTQPAYTFGPSITPNSVAILNLGIGASCGGCTAPSGGSFNTFVAGFSYTVKVVTTRNNLFIFTVQIGGMPSPTPPVGESLMLENTSFTNGTYTTLFIRNTGTTPVSFVTYYVKDATQNQYSQTNWAGAGITNQPVNGLITAPINIGAQCGCTAPSTPFTFTPGNSYTVIIITSKNNEFVFTITR